MARIERLEDLLVYMWGIAQETVQPGSAELAPSCCKIPIRIQGVTWDKRIDVRSAQFVRGLQRELNDFCQNYPEILGSQAPLLKVAIRDGSGILDPDFWALIREALPNMNKNTAAVLITLILTLGGYQAWDRYWASQDEARKQEVTVQAVQGLRDVAMQRGLDPVKTERPFKKLTTSLADDDRISVAGGPILPGIEAKQIVKIRSPRTTEVITPCDGAYILEKLDLTGQAPVLELSQGDFSVKAYLEHLSPEAKQGLLDFIDERLENRQAVSLNLQIDVRYTGKKVKYGSIVGVGTARPSMDHNTLAQLPPNQ